MAASICPVRSSVNPRLLIISGSSGLFLSACSNFAFAVSKSLFVKSAVPRRSVSRNLTGSMRVAVTTAGVFAVSAGAAGPGVDADAGRAAGRATSSVPVFESNSVMATMMIASDATVPKIRVPPPSLLSSGGKGSSGRLYATSGS